VLVYPELPHTPEYLAKAMVHSALLHEVSLIHWVTLGLSYGNWEEIQENEQKHTGLLQAKI
jgi:hypothetical protein